MTHYRPVAEKVAQGPPAGQREVIEAVLMEHNPSWTYWLKGGEMYELVLPECKSDLISPRIAVLSVIG